MPTSTITWSGIVSLTTVAGTKSATWSAVHGLAMLLLDGPLRDVSPELQQEATNRTMLLIIRGLGDLTPELENVLLDEISRPPRS